MSLGGRLAWLILLVLAAADAPAQNQREAERRLERVRKELKSIAEERRRLESERGEAAQRLRQVEERAGRSSRALAETEAALRREEAALAELQQRRDAMRRDLDAQRERLAALLRASYALGSHAPLKLLLAQDRVADANRALAYHRYVQRERVQRIEAIAGELEALAATEREIAERRAGLEAAHERLREQTVALRRDREARAKLMAELDRRFQDRSQRERALGQDAKALERLLANLRAAAARAEAERRAAAQREAQQRKQGAATGKTPPRVASAPPPKVGGLGWPVSGDLLARYGGKLPDGRASSGVLIGAPLGSTVTAVADGTVVFAEWMTGYGLILIVDHGNGYMSLYAHNDALLRDAGDRVRRGDAVAKVGNSGGHGRPALYFELRRNGQPVDPAAWLQRR